MPPVGLRKKKASYRHGNLREALIQAGLSLLATEGFGGLTLRSAARLAGVTHAAVYRHFRDREALVAAIAERGFRLLTRSTRAERAQAPADDARAGLLALARGYVRFATESPAYLQVMFGGLAQKQSLTSELTEAAEEAFQVVVDEVQAGITAGSFRPDERERISLACWALAHGVASLVSSVVSTLYQKRERALQAVESLVLLLNEGINARESARSGPSIAPAENRNSRKRKAPQSGRVPTGGRKK